MTAPQKASIAALLEPYIRNEIDLRKTIDSIKVIADRKMPSLLIQAYEFKKLKTSGLPHAEIARQKKVSHTAVDNGLRLLELGTPTTIEYVTVGAIQPTPVSDMLYENEPKAIEEFLTKAILDARKRGKSRITLRDVERAAGKKLTKKTKKQR